jgi:hypothetical protein
MEQLLNSSNDQEREAQKLSLYTDGLEWKDIKVLSKTMTDADGKFAIGDVPSEHVVLFALSSRKVKGTTETYCWLVTPRPTDHLIMLTNKNTIDTPAPENFAASHNN